MGEKKVDRALGLSALLLLKCEILFHNISEIAPATMFKESDKCTEQGPVHVRFVQIFRFVCFMLQFNSSYVIYIVHI